MRIVCPIRHRKTVIRVTRGGARKVWEEAWTTPGEKGGQTLEEVLLTGMEEKVEETKVEAAVEVVVLGKEE
jgi:hypothetical protein